jgi:hypothetical protein
VINGGESRISPKWVNARCQGNVRRLADWQTTIERNPTMSKILSVLIAGLFATSMAVAADQKSEPSKATPATPAAPAKGDAAKATPATPATPSSAAATDTAKKDAKKATKSTTTEKGKDKK